MYSRYDVKYHRHGLPKWIDLILSQVSRGWMTTIQGLPSFQWKPPQNSPGYWPLITNIATRGRHSVFAGGLGGWGWGALARRADGTPGLSQEAGCSWGKHLVRPSHRPRPSVERQNHGFLPAPQAFEYVVSFGLWPRRDCPKFGSPVFEHQIKKANLHAVTFQYFALKSKLTLL
jgi:hypothetical protein